MSIRSFLEPGSRTATTALIAQLEARTAAEVVISVHRQSSDYRAADLTAGALLAFASLLLILFLPRPFAVESIPLDVAIAFGVGALIASRAPWLERWLTPRDVRRRRIHAGARAAFVDLGVARTQGRTGVLVYVSLLEHAVEVVTDVGVDPAALGPAWTEALAALARSMSPTPDLARFQAGLTALGDVLARALPRAHDDRDELANEVHAA